MPAVRGLAIRR